MEGERLCDYYINANKMAIHLMMPDGLQKCTNLLLPIIVFSYYIIHATYSEDGDLFFSFSLLFFFFFLSSSFLFVVVVVHNGDWTIAFFGSSILVEESHPAPNPDAVTRQTEGPLVEGQSRQMSFNPPSKVMYRPHRLLPGKEARAVSIIPKTGGLMFALPTYDEENNHPILFAHDGQIMLDHALRLQARRIRDRRNL